MYEARISRSYTFNGLLKRGVSAEKDFLHTYEGLTGVIGQKLPPLAK